jgi:hypothetical protein
MKLNATFHRLIKPHLNGANYSHYSSPVDSRYKMYNTFTVFHIVKLVIHFCACTLVPVNIQRMSAIISNQASSVVGTAGNSTCLKNPAVQLLICIHDIIHVTHSTNQSVAGSETKPPSSVFMKTNHVTLPTNQGVPGHGMFPARIGLSPFRGIQLWNPDAYRGLEPAENRTGNPDKTYTGP